MFNPWEAFQQNDWLSPWSRVSAPQPPLTPDIYSQMTQLSEAFRNVFDSMQNQGADAAAKLRMEEMIRLFSLQSFMPGAVSAQVPFATNPWLDSMKSLGTLQDFTQGGSAQLPALGISREYHEDVVELARRQREYASALNEYASVFQIFSRDASQKFMSLANEMDAQSDFDAFCRKWIDVCEAEFQKLAFTDEYAKTYGNLIDSHVRLTQQMQRMDDKLSRLRGQPSRQEMEQIHRDIQQKDGEIRQLQRTVAELEKKISTAAPKTARRTAKKRPTAQGACRRRTAKKS